MLQNSELTTDDLLQMIENHRPPRHPGEAAGPDSSIAGMGHIIRILSENGQPVTAGKLSKDSGVSTARVAVMLRKLEEKGLITRSGDPKDARKTIVALTEEGKAFQTKKQAEFRAMLQEIISTIGEERLRDYIETTREISGIVEKGFQNAFQEDSEIFKSRKGETPS